MFSHFSVALALLSPLVMGTPLRRAMQVHEALQSTPSGYTLTGAASPDTVLSLRVALVQNNIDGLIEALYDVSTPSSSNYGKWLSKSDVRLSHLLSAWLWLMNVGNRTG